MMMAAGLTAIGLCAASHIRDGHGLKLREASWAEVEDFVRNRSATGAGSDLWHRRFLTTSRDDNSGD